MTYLDRESNVPNLDAETPDNLMSFWNRHQSGRMHRALFPWGGRGTKKAAGSLANYASNKATAMQCRLRGDIPAALMYEDICDRIYSELPEFAQW